MFGNTVKWFYEGYRKQCVLIMKDKGLICALQCFELWLKSKAKR